MLLQFIEATGYNGSNTHGGLGLAGRRQYGVSICVMVMLLLAATAGYGQIAAPDAHVHALLQEASTEMHGTDPRYVGPGSCSAVACHGGIQPRSDTKVLQNEYSTWVTADKHARAYTALTGPLGQQMAAILKIGPAEKAPQCLACHTLSVPPAEHGRTFDIAEGVSCESCHGPASLWLGPHIQTTALHSRMVALGLYDNKNLVLRSEKCLSCHLGTANASVDHAMITAGHPDLTFELDSFTAVEPPHWVEHAADHKGADADPLFGVRAWAIGEAVALRESMLRVSRRAKSGPWPEFSEMDCMTCHHALTGPQSWRQQEGYGDHRPGDPAYNQSRYTVFHHFANEIDPITNAELTVELRKLAALITAMSPDRAAAEASADHAAALAQKMVTEVAAAQYDRARTARLLLAITNDGDVISRQGERTAEQATMTVDSLYIAQAKSGGTNAATRSAIDGLFKLVNNPSAYNGPQFAAQMKRVRTTLQ
jgi:hypothetical protein